MAALTLLLLLPVMPWLELRSSVKIEVDVQGFESLTVHTVSVDVKQNRRDVALRSCVKVEVVVLGS